MRTPPGNLFMDHTTSHFTANHESGPFLTSQGNSHLPAVIAHRNVKSSSECNRKEKSNLHFDNALTLMSSFRVHSGHLLICPKWYPIYKIKKVGHGQLDRVLSARPFLWRPHFQVSLQKCWNGPFHDHLAIVLDHFPAISDHFLQFPDHLTTNSWPFHRPFTDHSLATSDRFLTISGHFRPFEDISRPFQAVSWASFSWPFPGHFRPSPGRFLTISWTSETTFHRSCGPFSPPTFIHSSQFSCARED